MMNEEEKRRYDRAWNDPPMFTMDQMNKQTSNVPLNKRYKYPAADQQLLNSQMYQPQVAGGYMQQVNAGYSVQPGSGGYGIAGGLGPNQSPYALQQSPYAPNAAASMSGYNQMNAYAGMPQQQSAYGTMYNQQQYAQQTPYSAQQQLAAGYGQAHAHQLAGGQTPIVSQQQTQSNYQTTQSSAYLPNTINSTTNVSTMNPALGTHQQQQIPVSNAMMQSNAYGNAAGVTSLQNSQYNQYGQPPPPSQQQQQQMYSQQQQIQQSQQQYGQPPQNQYHHYQ